MREVFCDDALTWLKKAPMPLNSSIIASLPDVSEFPHLNLEEWKEWFMATAELIFSQANPDGVVLFYQSDIKYEGVWVDKGYLIQKVAEKMGMPLLWHKIACRVAPGIATFGRPSYSKILCFSKNLRLEPGKSLPDVLPDLGEKTWQRGMGLDACLMIAKFLKEQTPTEVLIHPFCGEGSMIAVANHFGIKTIGIERSPKRAEKARRLEIIKTSKGLDFSSAQGIEEDRD